MPACLSRPPLACVGRCGDPSAIPSAASELACEGGKLQGATHSDHGFVVIGMFFAPDTALGMRRKEGSGGFGPSCAV